MRLSKNVNRALTYVLIIIVVVFGAQLVVGSSLDSSPVYVVVSKSMVPTLQIGDLVVTESVPFSSIHVGQVIVFVKPDSIRGCDSEDIVHRVVAITAQGLITQGDDRATNPNPDEPYSWAPITANCVRGVVVLAVPYLGLISMLMPYPWNYALVGLILVFVFLLEVRPSGKGGIRWYKPREKGVEDAASSCLVFGCAFAHGEGAPSARLPVPEGAPCRSGSERRGEALT